MELTEKDTYDLREQGALALEAARIAGWYWDIPAGTVRGDKLFAQLFGFDYDEQPWLVEQIFGAIHPEDVAHTQAAVTGALEGAAFYEAEFRRAPTVLTQDIPAPDRWIGGRGRISERAADGTPLRMVGVNWDITDTKTHAQRLSILASEMDHRVKNAFAVMRALVNLGMRTSDTKEDFGAALKNQISAMATAHIVSAKSARAANLASSNIPLSAFLDEALRPWTEIGIDPQHRLTLEIREDFDLSPQEASSFSMIVYELVTNATKHGVLAKYPGELTASASVSDTGTRVFEWREAFDDALVSAQKSDETHEGFGSVLLKHCGMTLRAKVTRDLTAQGLTFRMEIPELVIDG